MFTYLHCLLFTYSSDMVIVHCTEYTITSTYICYYVVGTYRGYR